MRQKTYRDTLHACYWGYITQAIINNLAPLLFVIFQTRFAISLTLIGQLILLNFGVQDVYKRQMASTTTKIAPIPWPINIKGTCKFICNPSYSNPGSSAKITPPATTDAICPDTFAPTACISR